MYFKTITKREQLTKSFKLELKPEEATSKVIDERGLLKKDEILKENMAAVAPHVDGLVKKIIADGLYKASYDFDTLYDKYIKKNEGAIEKSAYNKEVIKLEKAMAKFIAQALPDGLRKTADITAAPMIDKVLPAYVNSLDVSKEEKVKSLADIEHRYWQNTLNQDRRHLIHGPRRG